MEITFLITTYNRKESCQRLVDSLQGQGRIVVVNDGCDYIIEGVDKQIHLDRHYGRLGYLHVVEMLWGNRGMADYYFMLPDDFLPAKNMVEKGIRLWDEIKDSNKICLNLYADRIGMKCWTNFTPLDKGNVLQTQWVDMCFMSKERFFKFFSHFNRHGGLKRIHTLNGSGVGAYVSRIFHKKGYHLYQVKESLVTPQEEHAISQMHDNSTFSNDIRKKGHPTSHSVIFGKPSR